MVNKTQTTGMQFQLTSTGYPNLVIESDVLTDSEWEGSKRKEETNKEGRKNFKYSI